MLAEIVVVDSEHLSTPLTSVILERAFVLHVAVVVVIVPAPMRAVARRFFKPHVVDVARAYGAAVRARVHNDTYAAVICCLFSRRFWRRRALRHVRHRLTLSLPWRFASTVLSESNG